MSQVTEQSVRFQTALASIKLIQASAVLDLTEDDFDFLTSNKVWIETQKEIAGIQSATSRQNTKDQVYAQNEMLAYQQKESTARVASIMENTNLSKQQQVSEIMRQM